MKLNLNLQIVSNIRSIPNRALFRKWIKIISSHELLKLKFCNYAEVNLRIVDEPEMINLNAKYRNKHKSTNVLSFRSEIFIEFNYNVLGDIVICANVIEKEAKQQHKELSSHWAHMVVHGMLHLLGYDHQKLIEAQEMEQLEVILMQQLGFSSPY